MSDVTQVAGKYALQHRPRKRPKVILQSADCLSFSFFFFYPWKPQVRRYGLKILPFRTCYFRTFEKLSALRTSAPRLKVRRRGGADRGTEVPSSDNYKRKIKWCLNIDRACLASTRYYKGNFALTEFSFSLSKSTCLSDSLDIRNVAVQRALTRI